VNAGITAYMSTDLLFSSVHYIAVQMEAFS